MNIIKIENISMVQNNAYAEISKSISIIPTNIKNAMLFVRTTKADKGWIPRGQGIDVNGFICTSTIEKDTLIRYLKEVSRKRNENSMHHIWKTLLNQEDAEILRNSAGYKILINEYMSGEILNNN